MLSFRRKAGVEIELSREGGGKSPFCDTRPWFVSQEGMGTCLPCHTADIVCCVKQQTLSAVSHSRQYVLHRTADNVCCVPRRTLSALSHTADNLCCVAQLTMSAMSRSRHVCCVAKRTCLLCHTADMSAV